MNYTHNPHTCIPSTKLALNWTFPGLFHTFSLILLCWKKSFIIYSTQSSWLDKARTWCECCSTSARFYCQKMTTTKGSSGQLCTNENTHTHKRTHARAHTHTVHIFLSAIATLNWWAVSITPTPPLTSPTLEKPGALFYWKMTGPSLILLQYFLCNLDILTLLAL